MPVHSANSLASRRGALSSQCWRLRPACGHWAEPKAPSEEENADATFTASFIGKNYDGELAIEGWNDLGGGLIVVPIFNRHYQRNDGTFLVLTSRQLVKERKTRSAITRWLTR